MRLIDADEFAERMLKAWDTADEQKRTDIVAILANIVTPILVGTPTVDAVHRETLAQVMWERDVAMGQLEEHTIPFGCKADVQAVVHGEWILLDECANEGVYCSVCHKKVYRAEYANQKLKSNYCPNCGAKMDGKVSE